MEKAELHNIIREYFHEKPVRKVSVFGSYASGKEREESDVDILLELVHPVGLMELSRYKNDLEDLLEIKVDIGTESGISEHLAEEVRENASVVYEA
ncbi:nucleotidyltransferase family protein [Gracilimonas mengyeensis]|uniref:Polymerase nucleotidyl transferase domain-containing protein n=1 Tax=Gracilimonas mengyeensis TaxID=1302730 RepID=A0A521BFS4_9BACT|nr:nucleotidyltransferase domain-containing protein [Gracilimonas mengyeensis]SMO45948.1 hypothetical protein SAMN06265219_102262 [Gracilimonas mengyeensis]